VEPALQAESLITDDLVLICSPEHPLARKAEVSLEQMIKTPFALHGSESSTRRLTERWFDQQGLRLRNTVEVDSLEAIKQLVLLGGHISVMSRMAVQWEEQQGLIQVLPIEGELAPRYIYVVHNKDRHPSVQMESFRSTLLATKNC
jgi:DNA-binding transcriptional LysR family regulator